MRLRASEGMQIEIFTVCEDIQERSDGTLNLLGVGHVFKAVETPARCPRGYIFVRLRFDQVGRKAAQRRS